MRLAIGGRTEALSRQRRPCCTGSLDLETRVVPVSGQLQETSRARFTISRICSEARALAFSCASTTLRGGWILNCAAAVCGGLAEAVGAVVTADAGHGCAWRAEQRWSSIGDQRTAESPPGSSWSWAWAWDGHGRGWTGVDAGGQSMGTSGYATLAKVNVPRRGSALFDLSFAARAAASRAPVQYDGTALALHNPQHHR